MRDAGPDAVLLHIQVLISVRVKEFHHVRNIVPDQGCEEISSFSQILSLVKLRDPLKLSILEMNSVLFNVFTPLMIGKYTPLLVIFEEDVR